MYLDGEIPGETFKERMRLIADERGEDPTLYGYNRDDLARGRGHAAQHARRRRMKGASHELQTSDRQSIVDEATKWRRYLHAHPETAFEEHATADFVAAKLGEFGLEVHRGLGKTGVVGTLKRGTSPVAIGLRADMDALFIQEGNTFDYRSKVDGKMHACGHDGHTAMLLAAASHLARKGEFDGIVHFIFQPAEEIGDEQCGGNAMVKDRLFDKFGVEAVFGLHNLPYAPAGSIMMRSGPMLASIDTFEFGITSRLSHPASQSGVPDPLLIASRIVQEMHAFNARYLNPAEPVVLSITQFQRGNPGDRQSVHVTPEKAVVRGTLRAQQFRARHVRGGT